MNEETKTMSPEAQKVSESLKVAKRIAEKVRKNTRSFIDFGDNLWIILRRQDNLTVEKFKEQSEAADIGLTFKAAQDFLYKIAENIDRSRNGLGRAAGHVIVFAKIWQAIVVPYLDEICAFSGTVMTDFTNDLHLKNLGEIDVWVTLEDVKREGDDEFIKAAIEYYCCKNADDWYCSEELTVLDTLNSYFQSPNQLGKMRRELAFRINKKLFELAKLVECKDGKRDTMGEITKKYIRTCLDANRPIEAGVLVEDENLFDHLWHFYNDDSLRDTDFYPYACHQAYFDFLEAITPDRNALVNYKDEEWLQEVFKRFEENTATVEKKTKRLIEKDYPATPIVLFEFIYGDFTEHNLCYVPWCGIYYDVIIDNLAKAEAELNGKYQQELRHALESLGRVFAE